MWQSLLCNAGQSKTHHLSADFLPCWGDKRVSHSPDDIYILSYTIYHVTKIVEFQNVCLLLGRNSDKMLKL